MKGLLYVLMGLSVMGLAFWAYQENYETQDSLRRVSELHAQIGENRSKLSILNAEWAWLNRPQRLRELADLNFDRLELLPILPDAFGHLADVPEPLPELAGIEDVVELSSAGFQGPINPDEDPL
ncbi:cell division protein FtsL [Pseudoroseicyclus tamaricis]|uniref:Cell division protein FtsL n=1 Tax=Pseudoroseicyclus tamaricis TaxID=2705421 RepID=A0A6B2JUR0_9RHOB|nr:cell division protein FtsL [Pseudoroseicyclus tamaricis]NDV00359.1 cell division protein FtsL [Pseudoroseicyclus tamaricis]